MDRFPGSDTKGTQPGGPVPRSQGMKFLEFVQNRSKTGKGIQRNNSSSNVVSKLGTLDWWKRKNKDT